VAKSKPRGSIQSFIRVCRSNGSEFAKENILWELAADQTSLHNPWAGGYYPVGTFLRRNQTNLCLPESRTFSKPNVQGKAFEDKSLQLISHLQPKEPIFFDYGTCRILLKSSRAGADVVCSNGIEFSNILPTLQDNLLGQCVFESIGYWAI